MFNTLVLSTTVLLPLLGYSPGMHGTQELHVVWLSTPSHIWQDTEDARLALEASIQWWESQADVQLEVVEEYQTSDTDILSENICHLPKPVDTGVHVLYIVATDGTGMYCDGVSIQDMTWGNVGYLWGFLTRDSPADQAGIAHTLAHLWGALDTHVGKPNGPSRDIMDKDYYVQAYKLSIVAQSTWEGIGAVPR